VLEWLTFPTRWVARSDLGRFAAFGPPTRNFFFIGSNWPCRYAWNRLRRPCLDRFAVFAKASRKQE